MNTQSPFCDFLVSRKDREVQKRNMAEKEQVLGVNMRLEKWYNAYYKSQYRY